MCHINHFELNTICTVNTYTNFTDNVFFIDHTFQFLIFLKSNLLFLFKVLRPTHILLGQNMTGEPISDRYQGYKWVEL